MLEIIAQINNDIIDKLLYVYAESMDEIKTNFTSEEEMHDAYYAFLRDFISKPNQLILAESINDNFVSALRAIETAKGSWFLEAVETNPIERQKGFGEKLLLDTIDCLKKHGMTEITCTIAKNNYKSQKLHKKCGFVATDDTPLNCWGELEDWAILYRLRNIEEVCS